MDAWQRAQSARTHRATTDLADAVQQRRRVIEYGGYGSFFAQPRPTLHTTRFYPGHPREEAATYREAQGSDPLRHFAESTRLR